MLKPGAKRRRRQADIQGQNSEAEMNDLQAADQSMRIQALEQELSQVQERAVNNESAANILTLMLERGEAEQDNDGNVHVSKRKSGGTNIITNLENDY